MDKARIDTILAPVGTAEQTRREETVRKDFLQKAKQVAARVPFVEDIVAAYFCAMDPKTPTRAKAILIAALAYFVLPIDFIPDFLLVLGFTDDVAVATAAIATETVVTVTRMPSRTAKGSSPTCMSAHRTAWPRPRGSPWRT